MKLFMAFALIFVLFSAAKVVSTNIGRDLLSAKNVTVNVTWTFTSEMNVTNVTMVINNLESSQYAAIGLGQHRSMVDIEE